MTAEWRREVIEPIRLGNRYPGLELNSNPTEKPHFDAYNGDGSDEGWRKWHEQ